MCSIFRETCMRILDRKPMLADVSRESTTPSLLRATVGCTTYKIPESKCIITGKQRTGAKRANSAHFLSVIRSSTFRQNILWNIAMHFASLYMLVCTSIEFCPPSLLSPFPTASLSSYTQKNNLAYFSDNMYARLHDDERHYAICSKRCVDFMEHTCLLTILFAKFSTKDIASQ